MNTWDWVTIGAGVVAVLLVAVALFLSRGEF